MEKKGDLGGTKRAVVAGATWAGLSISEAAHLLGVIHTIISRVYREWSEN